MKLTGNLRKKVEAAATKDEAREAIRSAGMILDDAELDQVTGGLIQFGFAIEGCVAIDGKDSVERFCVRCNAMKMFRYYTASDGMVRECCKTCSDTI